MIFRTKIRRVAIASAIASIVAIVGIYHPAVGAPKSAAVLNIYVSPSGNDRNNGLSIRTPVKTIDRAEVVAVNNGGKKRDVDVRILRGTYKCQSAFWSTASPGKRVRFLASGGGTPVYDGCGKDAFWLNIEPPTRSSNTRFEVHGIRVTNYANGLRISGGYSYKGSWRQYATGIGKPLPGVVVARNTFTRIGDAFTGGRGTGYAAMQLQNVTNAKVHSNTFTDIRNRAKTEYSLIHGVYATYSSLEVSSNRFDYISGDAVRIRANTSGKVWSNHITRSGRYGAISDWYCNATCAKRNGQKTEKPSKGIRVWNNRVGRSFYGTALPQFKRTV